MIPVQTIIEKQQLKVADWHKELVLTETEAVWQFIEENHQWNFSLWHEEDIARIKDIDPLRIVEAKRNIDKFNQARNNAMEKIDEWILQLLQSKEVASPDKLHSETPGMMIDRLSIMSLKRYHMFEETERKDASPEHIEKCQARVNVLDEQIRDLSNSLADVLAKLEKAVPFFAFSAEREIF
ncbi:MAG: DUF4254 domain-containing protein [Rickettsiales bacterium]|nr:MAG: DUF4254 domain-containing protein [Rickettsiales bacterium]